MKKRYEIGDKVKLVPDSEYQRQSNGETGEITCFEYELPKDDSAIYDFTYYYHIRWKNGNDNVYRYIDLIPAEETIKEEKTLKQQAIERFGFISKDDKFTKIDPESDGIIKEENPDYWTNFSDGLYLAKSGKGGMCLCKYGKWAERASLPKNWIVKCSFNIRDQPELFEWKKSVTRVGWLIDGWIDNSGGWSDIVAENKGIITYEQFLKWVYNPWKALQSSDESIKPGDWVIGWHHSECKLFHTPWKVEKLDRSRIYAIPEGHPNWKCNISHLIKVPAAPQQSSTEKEWKPKFKIGDRVRAIYASHGWGCVNKGDIGTVIRKSSSFEKNNIYYVDFGEHKATYWKGHESCFELVEESMQGEFVYSPPKLSSIGEMLNPNDSGYKLQLGDTPLVRVITINGISSEFKNEQSINLSIHKPKKVKQLKLN